MEKMVGIKEDSIKGIGEEVIKGYKEAHSSLMSTMYNITFEDAKNNDLKRENANIDGNTAMGMMLRYGSESSKYFSILHVLEEAHSKAHLNGDIHIHDLDFLNLTTNCCQIDLIQLFKDGFNTGHGFLREPNDIMTYSSLACIAIQSNQNDQHGGQSIPNFEYAMADGVKKSFVKIYRSNLIKALELLGNIEDAKDIVTDWLNQSDIQPTMERSDLFQKQEQSFLLSVVSSFEVVQRISDYVFNTSMKEIDRLTYQAMEALIHNLNTMHSRAGAQIPFSSINYGTDVSLEGRLVMKNLLLATEAGLGKGETPIFPIQIFKVKEGINYNPTDVNYDLFQLACKVSAKRLYPNFSFLDAPFNLHYYKEGQPETEATYMGCRTRVIGNTVDPNNEIVYGRGNLSFTTVNLPRLAITSKQDIDVFFKALDQKVDLIIEQLIERFEIQARKKVKNFPFLMGQGIWLGSNKLEENDEIREVIKHGTLSLGFIGLAECLKSLTGFHHGESETSQQLGLKIIAHLRKRMDDASKQYNLNFSLIATPAEGLSGRFVKMDQQLFGKKEGITDRSYYTNSFHVPVYYSISIGKKIELEAPYHELTNAGHITYVELDGDVSNNLGAFEKIIRKMKESNIGYGSINHPVDRDPICGYVGVIQDVCPSCGRVEEDVPFERIRRITGYLVGTLERFNDAKQSEEQDRVKHFN